MNKYNVVAASAVALTAALASGNALAHGSVAVSKATYNAAMLAAGQDIFTVPFGTTVGTQTPSAVYTVTANAGQTTSLEVNSRFTVTLPTGFSFNSAPGLTSNQPTSSAVLLAGGIGSQSATFVITGAPLAQGNTLSLNPVAVQGSSAINTPGGSFSISEQSTNNAVVTNNDVAPLSGVAFSSSTGATPQFLFGTAGLPRYFIDLTPPALGTLFQVEVSPPFDAPQDILGTFILGADGSLSTAGTLAVLSSTDTATITINGFFNGIKEAFTTAGLNTLGPFGTVTATFPSTPTSVTYTNVPVTGTGVDLNLLADGVTLLQQNVSNYVASFTPGTGVKDYLGGTTSITDMTTDANPFTGGISQVASNFFFGSDAGYTALLRVTNTSSVANEIFLVAQPFSGGAPLTGSLGTLAAGVGTVFSNAQVQGSTGLTLANSGQRATLTLVAVPGGQVTTSVITVSPGGVIDNVN